MDRRDLGLAAWGGSHPWADKPSGFASLEKQLASSPSQLLLPSGLKVGTVIL